MLHCPRCLAEVALGDSGDIAARSRQCRMPQDERGFGSSNPVPIEYFARQI
jgi:hypothetical protein